MVIDDLARRALALNARELAKPGMHWVEYGSVGTRCVPLVGLRRAADSVVPVGSVGGLSGSLVTFDLINREAA